MQTAANQKRVWDAQRARAVESINDNGGYCGLPLDRAIRWAISKLKRLTDDRPESIDYGSYRGYRPLTEIIDYAGDPDRGSYRGFAALHDLMDANILSPFFDDNFEVEPGRHCAIYEGSFEDGDYPEMRTEYFVFSDMVFDGVSKYIIEQWERRHGKKRR